MCARHGLIAGATGTGKTVSRAGVAVFLPDVKGDLSGLAVAGTEHPKVTERLSRASLSAFAFEPSPVVFWDVLGESGHRSAA